jgi:hypothetical protein
MVSSKSNQDAPDSVNASPSDYDEWRATLDRLQGWYESTRNPLYAWEAIDLSLQKKLSPTIPDWCLAPLTDAAANLFYLTRGVDFRKLPDAVGGELTPDRAIDLVSAALSLSKKGKKNEFAALLEDRDTARDANRYLLSAAGESAVLDEIQARRSVSRDRAQRIVARGKRLLRGKVKPNP